MLKISSFCGTISKTRLKKRSDIMAVFNNNVKNKLLVMYFLRQMNTPLLGYQLEDYFVNNILIETIELHTILAELKDLQLIKTEDVFNRTYYTVTPKGTEALESLESGLTETSRALINDYVRDNRTDIVNANNVVTACRQTLDGNFELTLTLLSDAKPLMELKLMLDEESFAVNVTKKWPELSNDIYSLVMNTFINKTEEQ